MMSKIYTDNLARSNSDSARGIAGRGVTMQAIGPDLSNINGHYYNKFGHYKNDCAEFKAQRQSPLHSSPSSEGSWDLQLVGFPCGR